MSLNSFFFIRSAFNSLDKEQKGFKSRIYNTTYFADRWFITSLWILLTSVHDSVPNTYLIEQIWPHYNDLQ